VEDETYFSISFSGEIVTTIPTIGFNVETVEYKNISFTVWGKQARHQLSMFTVNSTTTNFFFSSSNFCRCWRSRQNSPIVETLFPEHTRLDLRRWQQRSWTCRRSSRGTDENVGWGWTERCGLINFRQQTGELTDDSNILVGDDSSIMSTWSFLTWQFDVLQDFDDDNRSLMVQWKWTLCLFQDGTEFRF
jgi:hypothetical protein